MAGRPTDKQKELEAKKTLEELGYELIEPNKFKCIKCGSQKSLKQNNFYKTESPTYSGCSVSYETTRKGERVQIKQNVLPWCKKCIEERFKELCIKTKDNKKLALYKMLQEMQVPWSEGAFDASTKQKGVVWKIYFQKLNSLPQYDDLTLDNSDEYMGNENDILLEEVNVKHKKLKKSKLEELVEFFGEGYDEELYYEFNKKYNLLKDNYDEKTGMHTEALLKYIKYSVREEKSLIDGDVKNAKEWGTLATNAAKAAKINPNQLSKADLMDGLNSFSEMSAAVEKSVDIVKILPRFKFRPSDALDFNLWCYVNYERNLNGLPEVEYEDIYKFYDEKVDDYISQYGDPTGIFDGDTSKNNRETIKEFIKPFKEGDE